MGSFPALSLAFVRVTRQGSPSRPASFRPIASKRPLQSTKTEGVPLSRVDNLPFDSSEWPLESDSTIDSLMEWKMELHVLVEQSRKSFPTCI